MFNQNNVDYEAFKNFSPETRKQMLGMALQWGGERVKHLLMVVYREDPDAELREFARENLVNMGVTPPENPGDSFTLSDNGSAVTLDGGDGLIRPREELAGVADLFLLNKGNRAYLEGRRAWVDSTDTYVLLGITLVLTAVAGAVIIGGSRQVPVFAIGIVVLLAVAFWIFFVAKVRENQRFNREGKLLQGQLVSAYGQWKVTRDSKNRRSRSYSVGVTGVVRTPDGQRLDISAERTRNDLSKAVLPPAGTPLAVIVIDEKRTKIL